MSMMEVLSQIRDRVRANREKNKPLPWFCLILSDKCIEPEKTCMECRVYQEHKEEFEHDHKNNSNQR